MKEELLNFKKLLERKCFASDDSFEYETENYIDVVRAINNEGAVAYIQDCFSRANQYLANNGIKCDEYIYILDFHYILMLNMKADIHIRM